MENVTIDGLARRTLLSVSIGGHDATSYVEPYLTSFEYTEHAEGKSDEICIELHDRDDKWINGWIPSKGAAISAVIRCLNWQEPWEHLTLQCGNFTCDEATYSGVPGRVLIKAVSASLTGPLRETSRTQAWEGYSLQGVAEEIARRNDLTLYYDAEAFPFDRQDQRNEADLAFLQRLSEGRGVSVKVHDDMLVLYSAKDADSRGSILTITRKGGQFTPSEYEFKDATQGTSYTACTVEYYDPVTAELHTYTYEPNGPAAAGETAKVLVLDGRVENEAQAMIEAQSRIRGVNKGETTGSFRIMGHPGLVAGLTVEMRDFGIFSGKYFVTKTTHSVDSGGYRTSAEIRKVLGY